MAWTLRGSLILLTLAVSIAVLVSGATASPQLPAGFIDTLVATGITKPTTMAWDPDGRLYVGEQTGDLRVVKHGKLLAAPYVHLDVDPNGERGLLGVAPDPQFTSNHYIYVYYTVPGSPAHNRVSRFTSKGDIAAPGSEHIVLELPALSTHTNHNGGALQFGRDGKLYIAVGENNEWRNSQRLDNLLGKILRINPDGSIPTDNPFYSKVTGENRLIWAYGLRNPFRFAFNPKSGRMFINDVGQTKWEEINDGIAGANYGWGNVEGVVTPPNPSYRNPLFAYGHGHTATEGCAITGGAFYRPPIAYFPASFVGRYFFGDYCSDWIRMLDPANGNAVSMFVPGIASPVDLNVGRDGSLYYLSRGLGRVGRISYQSTPTVNAPEPASGVAGSTEVRLTGTYLAGATAVKFNGKAAAFSAVWDTWLIATVPYESSGGPITVTTAAGTVSTAESFTVRLSVTDFSPRSGPVGTDVTISGPGLGSTTLVRFNGVNATFTVLGPTSVRAKVPPGATSGPITVAASAGKTRSQAPFNVTP